MPTKRPATEIVERIQYSFVPNHRDTMQALAHARFSNQEFRLVISLLNQTNGFLRDEDTLSLAFWSRLTGMSAQHLCHTIKRLLSKNVISKNGDCYRVNRPAHWSPRTLAPLPKQATVARWQARTSPGRSLPKQATEMSAACGAPLPEQATTAAQTGNEVLPNQAMITGQQSSSEINSLPKQATISTEKTPAFPGRSLPEQATAIAQTGNVLLPEQATPPDSTQARPIENVKENLLKKTGINPPRAPIRIGARGHAPGKSTKPFQGQAGAFLDWVSSAERVKFANRAKLMGIVRGTLVATEATLEQLQEWYGWIKRNDRYWKGREPPAIIGQLPEKFPTWLRDRMEGRPHGQLRKPGADPGKGAGLFRSVTAADLESGRARFRGNRIAWSDEEGDQE